MRTDSRLIPAVLLAIAACGPFEEDPTGPGSGGGGPTTPTTAIPLRLGSSQPEEGRGIAYTGDGMVVATWFAGRVDFDQAASVNSKTSFGAQDIGVAKYALDGTFQWVVQIGGSGGDVPYAVAATPDGGAVVAGYGSGGGQCGGVLAGPGGRDILLARIGPSGTCLWGLLIGGTGDDEARALAVDTDGSIVVAGLFRGTADFDPTGGAALLVSRGGSDAFVARYTSDGQFVSVSQGGGAEDDLFHAVHIGASGDVIAAGELRGTATFGSSLAPLVLQSVGGADIVVARYTALGGLRWAFRAGGTQEDRATAISEDPNEDLLVAGTFEGVADLDPGPGSSLVVSQGGSDIFLALYEPVAGDWDGLTRVLGGMGAEGVTGLARHISGRILLTGSFQQTVDFDPGPGAKLVTARGTGGAGDLFVYAFSSQGDFAWVVPVGGVLGGDGLQSIAYGLALDDLASVWTVGRFYGRADFDPSDQALELTAVGESDGWVARYSVDNGSLLVTELPD
jgi:hypothetical protein